MKKEELKLTIELVPKANWENNLRKCVTQTQWNKIRRTVRTNANGVCKICGRNVGIDKLDAHETWEYKDGNQILKEINALCKACHGVKHYGLSEIKGYGKKAYTWFIRVNNITLREAVFFLNEYSDEYEKRSKKKWKIVLVNSIVKDIINEDIRLNKKAKENNKNVVIVETYEDVPEKKSFISKFIGRFTIRL